MPSRRGSYQGIGNTEGLYESLNDAGVSVPCACSRYHHLHGGNREWYINGTESVPLIIITIEEYLLFVGVFGCIQRCLLFGFLLWRTLDSQQVLYTFRNF